MADERKPVVVMVGRQVGMSTATPPEPAAPVVDGWIDGVRIAPEPDEAERVAKEQVITLAMRHGFPLREFDVLEVASLLRAAERRGWEQGRHDAYVVVASAPQSDAARDIARGIRALASRGPR